MTEEILNACCIKASLVLHIETADLGQLPQEVLVGGHHEVPKGASGRCLGEQLQASGDSRVAAERGDRGRGGDRGCAGGIL